MKTLTLGFSPCPNDTFIFDSIANGSISLPNYEIKILMEDVQSLNEWALEKKLDITKVSYGVYPLVKKDYTLLNSGGALGTGVGPLLVSKKDFNMEDICNLKIAIPGINTTAHLLFSLAFPDAKNKTFAPFHEIQNMILSGEADAGVIIHENRFTFHQLGLKKIIDLGEFWEEKLNCPIPLGGIIAKKNLPLELISLLEKNISESIENSWKNFPELSSFIRQNAQEMSEDVMRKHIQLYVNEYSLNLGTKGLKAVNELERIYHQINQSV
jgi:1,4-dihydroxy-6-naphthoate synthase